LQGISTSSILLQVDILKGLNKRQQEAVQATEGPVLILAGAGSGKTRALTHRIAYLIFEKNISPRHILSVTFTNKAADVMKQRINALLQNPKSQIISSNQILNSKVSKLEKSVSLPWLGTFHSICVKMLRLKADDEYVKRDFVIYDEQDSLRAIKKAMADLGISAKDYNPRAIRAFISGAKSELLEPSEYQKYALDVMQKVTAKVFVRYEQILQKSNALDFDDLILKTVKSLQKNRAFRDYFTSLFRYILVDEYQDTNHAQYMFLKILAQKHKNIFVIGDDWQSIYSFRGAKFQNILDFKKDYSRAKVIYLEENYRSTTAILESAQAVIKKNELRSDKNLFTARAGGAPVSLISASSKEDEIEFILDEIESVGSGEGRELKDFVILYRTNAQSRAFEELLVRRKVPYRIYGGLRFYERKEVKDILSYLSLLKNSFDLMALSRIINVPVRGIGEVTLQRILALGDAEARRQIPKYRAFADLLDELRLNIKNKRPDEIIENVIHKTGYKKFLSDGSPESETRLENIEELKVAASNYENLDRFLEAVALVADIDNYNENNNILTLMTIHAAKGMEFPVVFITGLEEGLFPHANSMSDQFELEEERRLFYVGMTRAMHRLYIGYSKIRVMYGRLEPQIPSRFIAELPEKHLDIIEI